MYLAQYQCCRSGDNQPPRAEQLPGRYRPHRPLLQRQGSLLRTRLERHHAGNRADGSVAGNNYQNTAAASVDSPGKNVVANLTYAISPKIVNEFEFVYAQGTYFSQFEANQFANNATAYSALQPNTQKYNDPYGRMPAVSIQGIQGFSPGQPLARAQPGSKLLRQSVPVLWQTHAAHGLRASTDDQDGKRCERRGQLHLPSTLFWRGRVFVRNGQFPACNSSVYSQASRDIIPDLNYYNTEAYLQDDWKLNQKLTLNLGVRWSALPSPSDTKNTLSNFDPDKYSSLLAPQIDANGNSSQAKPSAGMRWLPIRTPMA